MKIIKVFKAIHIVVMHISWLICGVFAGLAFLVDFISEKTEPTKKEAGFRPVKIIGNIFNIAIAILAAPFVLFTIFLANHKP